MQVGLERMTLFYAFRSFAVYEGRKEEIEYEKEGARNAECDSRHVPLPVSIKLSRH
jgi:hypothetical protein